MLPMRGNNCDHPARVLTRRLAASFPGLIARARARIIAGTFATIIATKTERYRCNIGSPSDRITYRRGPSSDLSTARGRLCSLLDGSNVQSQEQGFIRLRAQLQFG